MKRRIFLFFLLAFFLSTAIFWRKIATTLGDIALQQVLQEKFAASLQRDQAYYENGQWIFQNVSIERNTQDLFFSMDVERLEIAPSWKNGKFFFTIALASPQLDLIKKEDFSFSERVECSYDFFSISVDKGCFSLVDETKKRSLKGTFSKLLEDSSHYLLETERSKVLASTFSDGLEQNFLLEMECLELDEAQFLGEFFFNSHLAHRCLGRSEGSFQVVISDQKDPSFTLYQKIPEFFYEDQGYRFSGKKGELRFSYPEKGVSTSPLAGFFFSKGKNSSIFCSFEEGKMEKEGAGSFQDIQGFFSYDPGIGPKASIEAVHEKGTCLFETRGYFHSEKENWVDSKLSISEEALFCRARESEEGLVSLQFLCENFSNENLSILQDCIAPIYPDVKAIFCVEGTASFDLMAYFSDREVQRVCLKKGELLGTKVLFQSENIELSTESIELEGSYNFQEKSPFHSLYLQTEITGGKAAYQDYFFSEIKGDLCIEKGQIAPAKIFCIFEELENHIEIAGHLNEISLTSMISGNTQKLFHHYNPSKSFSKDLHATISLKRKNQEVLVFGNAQIAQEEISFGFDVNIPHFKEVDVQHGWMRAKEVCLENYTPFFQNIHFAGAADVSMQYQKKRAHFALTGENYVFGAKGVDLHLDQKTNLSFSYDLSSNSWDFDTFLQKAKLEIRPLNMYLEEVKGPLSVRGNRLKALGLKALSGSIKAKGDVFLDFQKGAKLDLHIKEFKGPYQAFKKILQDNDLFEGIDLEGTVVSTGKGFYYSTDFFHQPNFGFEMELKEAFFQVNETVSIENLETYFCYDSEKAMPSFATLSADASIDGQIFSLKMPFCHRKTDGSYLFDVRLEDALWDLVRIKGKGVCNEDGQWSLSFEPEKASAFGVSLQTKDILIGKNGEMQKGEISCSFPLSILSQHIPFFTKAYGLKDWDISQFQTHALQGNIEGKMRWDLDSTEYFLEAEHLLFGEERFKKGKMYIQKSGEEWLVHECRLDDFSASFSLKDSARLPKLHFFYRDEPFGQIEILQKTEGLFSANIRTEKISIKDLPMQPQGFLGISGQMQASGYASFRMPSKGLPCDFDVDLDIVTDTLTYQNKWDLKNASMIHLSYSLKEGLLVTGLDFSLESALLSRDDLRCKIGSLGYEKGEVFFHEVAFYVPQDAMTTLLEKGPIPSYFGKYFQEMLHLPRDIKILTDIRVKETGKAFSCKMSELVLPFEECLCRFEDVSFSMNESACHFESLIPLENSYYRLKSAVDFGEKKSGSLRFEELNVTDIPLTILWEMQEGRLAFQSMIGAFSGLDVSFHQTEDLRTLSGSLKVDFSKAKKLFSKRVYESLSSYDIAKGYEFRGKLFLSPEDLDYRFSGIFTGKNFEAMGYSFKTLLSKVDLSPKKFLFSDAKISDSSGIIKIDEIVCDQDDGDQFLRIPKIHVMEFRPSLFKELDKPLGPVRPFVIKNMEMENFLMNFSDPKACKAEGFFHFTNTFKKAHSIFDLPADIMGRIFGLDLELLIPIKGDVTFLIQDGKVTLTHLANSFSQGDRSQFFLAEKYGNLPFIDLDGDLNIYIKMKQFVLFKFTENFVISITGKLHDPKFGLQRKSSFFSS